MRRHRRPERAAPPLIAAHDAVAPSPCSVVAFVPADAGGGSFVTTEAAAPSAPGVASPHPASAFGLRAFATTEPARQGWDGVGSSHPSSCPPPRGAFATTELGRPAAGMPSVVASVRAGSLGGAFATTEPARTGWRRGCVVASVPMAPQTKGLATTGCRGQPGQPAATSAAPTCRTSSRGCRLTRSCVARTTRHPASA